MIFHSLLIFLISTLYPPTLRKSPKTRRDHRNSFFSSPRGITNNFSLHSFHVSRRAWESRPQQKHLTQTLVSPAALASLHASYMSCFMSGLSSPILSATDTNLSMARLTDCPTRPIARRAFSEAAVVVAAPCCGCSEWC